MWILAWITDLNSLSIRHFAAFNFGNSKFSTCVICVPLVKTTIVSELVTIPTQCSSPTPSTMSLISISQAVYPLFIYPEHRTQTCLVLFSAPLEELIVGSSLEQALVQKWAVIMFVIRYTISAWHIILITNIFFWLSLKLRSPWNIVRILVEIVCSRLALFTPRRKFMWIPHAPISYPPSTQSRLYLFLNQQRSLSLSLCQISCPSTGLQMPKQKDRHIYIYIWEREREAIVQVMRMLLMSWLLIL